MYTKEEYDIYLKVKHELLLEDARNNVMDYLENEDEMEDELNSYDYEYLVEQFEERYDYYDPFAEVWENIVRDYFE